MGKVIAKQIRGMSWNAKVSLVLICTLVMSVFMYEGWYKPRQSQAAAVAVQQSWSAVYGGTAYPTGTLAYTVNAGSSRMLVVGVSSTITSAITNQSCSVSYGGRTMTQATANNGTSAQQHTYLFYLNEAGIAAAGANTGISVTFTNGTSAYTHVYAAVFNSVDQGAITGVGNYNGGAATSSTIGPLDTALTLVSGDQAIDIVNLTRTGSSSARTVSSWGSGGWASAFSTSGSNGSNYAVSTTIGTTTTAGTTIPSHTASGSAQRAMSGMVLKAIQNPVVTDVTPAFANPGQSISVTIGGSNFVSGATASFGAGVTVNNTIYTSSTQLTANITVDAGAAIGNRDVTVTNPDTKSGTFIAGFRVASLLAPTITAISPAVLGQGATSATLAVTGTNFDNTSAVTVSGAGVTAIASYVDSTHLNVAFTVTGAATVGVRDLTVTNSDGSNTTASNVLTIKARPTITAVSPLFGKPGDTGKTVTITGTGFTSGSPLAASFSSPGVTVTATNFVSATQITATVNIDTAASANAGTVTVVNGDYGVSAAGGSFSVTTAPAPAITSLSTTALSSYASNFKVTINGANFLNTPAPTVTCSAASGVTITGVTFVDANTLTFLVTNSNSSGTATFTVANNDGQTATSPTVTFNSNRPGSTITAAPVKLTSGTTSNVTFTGSSFQNGAMLTFSNAGISAGPATFVSSTTLTASITVTAGATGTSTVTVTNPDGGTRTSGSGALTVTPVGVFSVSPGIPRGATKDITITGQGFASGAIVSIGGAGLSVNTVNVIDAATLTANVSADSSAAAGTYDITVTVGANSGTGTGVLTVTAGPTIASIAPSLRQGDIGKDVTITGSNFAQGCTVLFNGDGVTLNNVTYVNATQLTANVSIDQNAPIAGSTVTVTNPDGGQATGGNFAVLLTGKTVTGNVTFAKVTQNAISMLISYAGDGNGDGSCSVSYGTTPALELGTVAAVKGNGTYSASFSNLTGAGEGVGRLYYFRVTFADGDGIIGSSQFDATQPTKGSQLLHNSQNTFSAKWNQGWGIDGGKYGAFTCATCHNENTANSRLVAETIQAPALENWSSSNGATLNVVYTKTLGDDSAHATSTYVCEVCHSRTNHHKYNNPQANHQGNSDCIACHSHNEGFLPSCKECHSKAQGANGYRRQIVGNGGDFFTNMSTHGKFTEVSSQTCTVCHDATLHQSFSDGVSVALKNGDTGAQVIYDGTTATAAATATVCISCHDADGATRLGSIAGAPFAASEDFRTPVNIGQYWPGANGAHNTKMQCMNCHGSSKGVDGSTTNPKYNAHASGNKHVLQDPGYDVVNPNNFCFNCHNASSTDPNKSSKDVAGQFAKTYKHTTAKCFDCHGDESNSLDSMHSLRAGSQTAGSGNIANNIANATGRDMTWSINSWGGTTASAGLASNTVTAEYQVCFKCHAATGTGTTPDVPGAGTAAASLTNLALEFNPNNASRHPVGTALDPANRLAAARLAGGWVPGSVMTCSDCHATDTTASKGPHGSSVKWMLAGTNKAWPYTLASQNGGSTGTLYRPATYNTGAGTTDGLFCLNCHTIRPASGGNNWHGASGIASGQHQSNAIVACASCHIRVPHGGKISRLLQTTNVPSRYRSNGNGASSSFDFWGTSSVNIKGSSMSSSNFNSSCSQHNSGGAGGEAW